MNFEETTKEIKGKIRVFTAFSGYDSQCMALDRLKSDLPEFDYELVGWSEIDKYAIQAHNAVYPQWADRNYGDISKINWDEVPDFDLFTYSSPCQDFSNAGMQRGGEEGSGTRSSLLWECRRAILAKKPKYLLLENVAALVSKKFLPLFNKWQLELEGYGYSNFAQVLNAKNYGIPQNRERIFLVSILGDEKYSFPQSFKLELRLKDMLEKEVDEKYYLSDKTIKSIIDHCEKKKADGCNFTTDFNDGRGYSRAITTLYGSRQTDTFLKCNGEVKQVGNLIDDTYRNFKNPQTCRVYDAEGCAPTLTAMEGGSREPKIIEPICLNSKVNGKQPSIQDRVYDIEGIATACTTSFHPSIRIPQATAQGYAEVQEGGVFDAAYPSSSTRRGRVQDGGKVAPTLCTSNELCVYDGVEWKGHRYPNGSGLYLEASANFQRDGLKDMSRCLKAAISDAGVVQNYRIRKLTPRECFRLMGVSEENIDKIQAAWISNSQQYKMAGNSIVVDTLYHIFKKMFIDKEKENNQLLF